MSDRVQDLTNHRKVAVACKNYTDNKCKDLEDRLVTMIGKKEITTDDHTNELAYQITAPSGAKLLQLQAIGGNSVKYNPSVASDSTKAMIKTMPSTVYTFNGDKFYGDSRVSENLITPNTFNSTVSVFSFGNGILTASNVDGSPYTYANAQFKLYLSAGSYRVKFFDTSLATEAEYNAILVDENGNQSDYGLKTALANSGSYSLTISTSGNYGFRIKMKGSTKMMLVAGTTTPTTFVKGFDNIHNLELSGLKVEGANLFDLTNTTSSQISVDTTTGNVTAFNSGYADGFIYFDCKPYTDYYIKFSVVSYTVAYQVQIRNSDNNAIKDNVLSSTTFNSGNNTRLIIRFRSGTGGNVGTTVYGGVMIVRGTTTNLSYTPYIAPTTKTIDLSTILYNGSPLFEGNSLKGVDNVADEITPYKAIKRFGVVNLETLTWNNYNSDTTGYSKYANAPSDLKVDNDSYVIKALTPNYEIVGFNSIGQWTAKDKVLCGVDNAKRIIIRDTSGITPTGYLVYELVTPIEVSIDWSATLRNIQGYPNGSIIAENTHNMEVESVITYNSIIQETLCPSITITRNGVEVETRNLPTQASDGYGVNSSVHNLRVFSDYEGNETKERHIIVGKVDLGSLTWASASANRFNSVSINTLVKAPTTDATQANILCDKLTTAVKTNIELISNQIAIDTGGAIWVSTDGSYATAEAFKTAMSGVYLYYELATEDISQLDDFDYFFDVEEGDVITFNNTYAQQVYATYSFIIKEAKSNE